MSKVLSVDEAYQQALELLDKAHIPLSKGERAGLRVLDFGLRNIARYGVQLVEYINFERYCARQLIFLPGQTIPEHMHPPIGEDPGKVETFRVVWGKVWAYTEGKPSSRIAAHIASEDQLYFSAFRQIELKPGDQCTIEDNKYHWFQAGEEGAVVIEFSSHARDRFDNFKDPRVNNQ
ncbi:D-lyxose/D-mannose family sugar isomerase [Paenibacillus abyssi]|uniref:D-lyxose ketol-isomerase n=1 Tax=Paenibacillus abyssi TaxID=1340531 RepID=A0A917G4T2_9BACL|nr:D-lyxose/D-mannose family sugar isomerase [Paenibacillus abyssi]GGG22678.1 D-lyxose isomerase [Paenibacillus abyssi]